MNKDSAPNAQDKTVDSLSDDELVDAFAMFGIDGLDVEDDHDAGPWLRYLGRLGYNRTRNDDITDLDDDFGNRFYDLRQAGRLVLTMAGYIALSPREWAKRLEGKTSNEIERMLRGATLSGNDSEQNESTTEARDWARKRIDNMSPEWRALLQRARKKDQRHDIADWENEGGSAGAT